MLAQLATWIRSFLSPSTQHRRSDTMLAYYLSMVDVRSRQIQSKSFDQNSNNATLYQELRQGLAAFETRFPPSASSDNLAWNEVYRLDRLLALLEPAEILPGEVRRRVEEAGREKLGSATRLMAASDQVIARAFDTNGTFVAAEEATLRSLLLEVLEELHWAYQRKFYARPIRKSATKRLICFGFVAFLIFMLPYLVLYFELYRGGDVPFSSWTWLPLYSALTAGLFGAMFSRLLFLQGNWSALSVGGLVDSRDIGSILLRGCVGMMGAVIVSFFLQSHVITGALFPDFAQIGMEEKYYPSPSSQSTAGEAEERKELPPTYPQNRRPILKVGYFLCASFTRAHPSHF